MRLALRASASSGWLPAGILGLAATTVVVAFGTPIWQVAIFGVYVLFGIALPGMLWVRLLRGRSTHISEDLTLGLAVGYCVEIATYIAARAAGVPLLFLLWPIVTLAAFAAIPSLRRFWRGDPERAPVWWSWSLATMVGYLLIYAAGTFFAGHHLSGADTPYVDMPYHLALIGELRHHVPPEVPYVVGQPLAYHWFYYAETAATSWATGIEPITLLYRLSGLPMFVTFVVLTAAAARRLTGGWWSGPVAVGVALFGAVAGPYRWTGTPVFDAQTLAVTWISPTNLFGLALFAATVLVVMDLVRAETRVPWKYWVIVTLLVFGAAGAKASLLPLLIVGLTVVVGGVAISRHRLNRNAAAGLAVAGVGLALAAILLFRGTTGGLVIGLDSLRSFPVVHNPSAGGVTGVASVVMPFVGWLIALLLWSFLWAGAYVHLARRQRSNADPRIMLLLGICAGAIGAVTVFSYPGLSQNYYMKGAVGAFGLLAVSGIAAVLPARTRYLPLLACVGVAALAGAVAVLAIREIGPAKVPTVATAGLTGVLPVMILPVLALLGIAAAAYIVLRRAEPKRPVLQGAVPLLVIALVMGFSLPNVANVVVTPVRHLSGLLFVMTLATLALLGIAAATYLVVRRAAPKRPVLQGAVPLLVIAVVIGLSLPRVADFVASRLPRGTSSQAIPGDGIEAARWLRAHSDPDDLVATNLHCRPLPSQPGVCDARHFWVSGYSERHMLVEGWAYTAKAFAIGTALGVSDRTIPFWDQALLAENDRAFTDPSPDALVGLRDGYGVRWLFADLTSADGEAIGRWADLRYRQGDFGVYELRRP